MNRIVFSNKVSNINKNVMFEIWLYYPNSTSTIIIRKINEYVKFSNVILLTFLLLAFLMDINIFITLTTVII